MYQKENYDDVPSDKKRKLGRELEKRLMSELKPRVRQAFLALNARSDSSPSALMRTPTSITPRKGGARAEGDVPVNVNAVDVEALLSMKMTGKNKFDYKVHCAFEVLKRSSVFVISRRRFALFLELCAQFHVVHQLQAQVRPESLMGSSL